jgi:hypothetical protein
MSRTLPNHPASKVSFLYGPTPAPVSVAVGVGDDVGVVLPVGGVVVGDCVGGIALVGGCVGGAVGVLLTVADAEADALVAGAPVGVGEPRFPDWLGFGWADPVGEAVRDAVLRLVPR